MNDYRIDVIRTDRRTVAVEIISGDRITVRAPKNMRDSDIKRFLKEKSGWIQKHLALVREREAELSSTMIPDDIGDLKDAAATDLGERAERFAAQIGVSFRRITIRRQKKRWGSCSAGGNLNFNYLLMLCPSEVRDYVVIHELCHLIEFNHSRRFWANVERIMPGYKIHRQWLKTNGKVLISLNSQALSDDE